MKKGRLLKNAGMSTVQIIIVTGSFIYMYKYLLGVIGIERLGIWSLVIASTSITQIANLGMAGGVVKFVAKYFARGELDNLNGIVQTALWSLAVASGLLMIVAYPLCAYGLSFVIPANRLPEALQILPYAMISVWVNMTGSVPGSSLEGLQRYDLTSISQVSGTLFYLILTLWLAGKFGLLGLAWAKVTLSLFVVFLNFIFLKRCFPPFSIFPLKWEKRLFREIIGYSINFQVMSLMTMLYDPVTKAILSKFGGLSFVGYYEMAARMITQLRSIIVSANGVIVPVIAEFHEQSPDKINNLFITSYQLMLYLAIPAYSLTIVSIPLISKIWIGHYEPIFVVFGSLLAWGWFLNTLNGPAYFTYLGTGELRWNVISHIATAVLNPVFGIILGLNFGGIGVVVAWVFSLAVGSSIINLSFYLKNSIPLNKLLPKSSIPIAVVCSFGIFSAIIIQSQIDLAENPNLYLKMLIGFFSMVSVSLWFHPIRRKLFAHVREMQKKPARLTDLMNP